MIINLSTKEEKRLNTLKNYVKEQCQILQLSNTIAETAISILQIIFAFDSSKRANVKDGLFVVVIYWILRSQSFHRPIDDLRNKLNIDQKYITKAQSLFIQVVQKEKNRHPFFNKIVKIMAENDIVTDFLDKYSFALRVEFDLDLTDIQKLEAFIRKFEEYCNLKNSQGLKSQNGSKNFVYTPNSIILGSIYYYICVHRDHDRDHDLLKRIISRFGSSQTSIKRVCKEIEKAIAV